MVVFLGQVLFFNNNLLIFLLKKHSLLNLIIAVGTIGVLQALEALKIVLDLPHVLSGQLLLFDGLETKFRKINLRGKNSNCAICSEHPTLYKLIDYEQFCGAKANDKEPKLNLLKNEERISVEEYNATLKLGTEAHLLIDVRSTEEFDICHLKNSINIPLRDIINNEKLTLIKNRIQEIQKQHNDANCMYILLNILC